MADDGPGAMVEAPVVGEPYFCFFDQLLRGLCQFRGAGGRVLHIIQWLGKTAKVVDGFGLRHSRYMRAPGKPMGGYHQYGGGSWDLLSHLRPAAAEFVILNTVHGGTMA